MKCRCLLLESEVLIPVGFEVLCPEVLSDVRAKVQIGNHVRSSVRVLVTPNEGRGAGLIGEASHRLPGRG